MPDAAPNVVPGFWRSAQNDPDRVALITPQGEEVRAGDLLAASNQLVGGLRKLGLTSGSCVVVALPNSGEIVELFLAAMQAGFFITPVNTHLAASEIAYILSDSGAAVFVTDESLGERAASAASLAGLPAQQCFARGSVPGFRPYAELRTGQSEALPGDRVAGQMMQYTSGTTGRPKGVCRQLIPMDPDTMAGMFSAHLRRFDIEPAGEGVHLCGSPMYHLAALAFAWFSLHFEHRVVVMEKWEPESALRQIERHRVTTTHMVPTQFHRLLQLPEEVKARYDVSSLQNVMHAAAPCPVEEKRRMLEWWGPVIYEYYGASEGGGALAGPQEWLEHPGTVGRAWEGAEIRIFDDDGASCPAGVTGTVYMKLLQDFEYKGDPEKTRSGRIGEFFTVGDVGTLDSEGYLYLCGRKIDMIISGGVNIYPAEVEAALLLHDEVGDAAVFGIPDDDWGEQVKAVVEPGRGVAASAALAERLRAHCREHLAGYKCPRSVDFVDALPRDPNGKLYKRKLRDSWWEGRERDI